MVDQQKAYQMNILENKIFVYISLSKIITKICVICNCHSKYFSKETQYIYNKLVYFGKLGKFKYVYKLAFAFFFFVWITVGSNVDIQENVMLNFLKLAKRK